MPHEANAAATLVAEGYILHDLPLDRMAAKLRGEWKLFRALCTLYRTLSPDIVHHITVKPVLYGSLARRVTGGGPVVNAIPGLGYLFVTQGRMARVRRALAELLYRAALGGRETISIFQNPDDVALFVERRLVRAQQVELIRGSGVDLDEFAFADEPAGVPLVILPARMLRDKGVFEFVDAARQLRVRGIAARFALVGDCVYNRAAIDRAQLEAWQREGLVEWWGHRSDMVAVYRAATIICLPSYREGVPKVLLEAAATGRAIVTTDVPGCREVVTDGVNGLLVPSRDSAALALAIERLLLDANLRHRFTKASRARAEHNFSASHVVERTLDLYRRLLSARLARLDPIV